jgi:sphinganine-1-phosphate aldolase
MPSKLALPEQGRDESELLAEMARRKSLDADWERGRIWSLVYSAGPEHTDFLIRAYRLYFSENALSPTAFPSLARFEAEILAMLLDLLGGAGEAGGTLTSGGTESILLAMKAYRDRARAAGMAQRREILIPASAHPAFLKAAHYFDLVPVTVALDGEYRADLRDLRRKLSGRTLCLVASAPSYPQGVVDPIPAMGALALEQGLGLHVDACLGGFLLPFLRLLGEPVPDFDFRVPGVTSISADLHKNGYSPKGASAVLYRDADLRGHQFFATEAWPGGLYGSPGLAGTRSGGVIAAAWAGMMRLGRQGYLDLARRGMAVARRLMAGIGEIPELHVIGRPAMTVFSFGAEGLDIFRIAEGLKERGWRMDRQRGPDALHMIATAHHEPAVEPFLADLRAAVEEARAAGIPAGPAPETSLYGVTAEIPPGVDAVAYLRRRMGEVYDLEEGEPGDRFPRQQDLRILLLPPTGEGWDGGE